MCKESIKGAKPPVHPYSKRTIENNGKQYMQIVRADNQILVGAFSNALVNALADSNRRLATPPAFANKEEVKTPHGWQKIERSYEHANFVGVKSWRYVYTTPAVTRCIKKGDPITIFGKEIAAPSDRTITEPPREHHIDESTLLRINNTITVECVHKPQPIAASNPTTRLLPAPRTAGQLSARAHSAAPTILSNRPRVIQLFSNTWIVDGKFTQERPHA